MAEKRIAGREPSTWPEIAAYLGVSVRTAQKYERTGGMPVHRMPGERGRVWASAEELEEWKAGLSAVSHQPSAISRQLSAVAVVVAIGLLAGYWWLWRAGPAVGMRVGDKEIVATDARGRKVWRRGFPESLFKPVYEQSQQYWVRFPDPAGDGGMGTLFSYCPVDFAYRAGAAKLYSFDEDGKTRWSFTPGREVANQQQSIPAIYHLTNFVVVPKKGGQGPWIVATSAHGWGYADQVAVLDRNGRMEGEYWHAGHLPQMALLEGEGDGPARVVLGGVNNGYERATLVVFDPRRVRGASAEPAGDYRQFRGMEAGSERVVVLFKRSCFCEKLEGFNQVMQLHAASGTMTVMVKEGFESRAYVIYHLDRNFQVQSVTVSDSYVNHHKELFERGVLDHEFSVKEAEELRGITVMRR